MFGQKDPKDQSKLPNGQTYPGYNLSGSVDKENQRGIENQSDLVKVQLMQVTT